ncbi:MAG: 16S rRNA (cytidine(1402)-2'-O)-methyltransferase [Patescibacteria group bacterium]
MGTLYIVATPIGNLEDITLRALRILKEVDVVLCEDTRVTKKLLSHYDIHVLTQSFHAHSTLSKVDQIIEMLKEGKNLALVTDAGTPAISDPGSILVSKVREELGNEAKVVAIPGPSALTAALSIVGIPGGDFIFLGFLPHKKGRETLFKEMAATERAVVFYESPHRILKTLASLREFVSVEQPLRKISIARELSKIYEEVLQGSPEELLKTFETFPEKERGEFVVILWPRA